MGLVEFSKSVKKVENKKGEIVYFPIMILDGKETYFSSRGNIVFFDNKQDAEEYIED